MSDEDTLIWRMTHVEETCAKHDIKLEKVSEQMSDAEKHSIRTEGSQKEHNIRVEGSQKELKTSVTALADSLKTSVDALKDSLEAVTEVVEEIKDRPMQTHRALIRALWVVGTTVTAALIAFMIENYIMFQASVAKGLIK